MDQGAYMLIKTWIGDVKNTTSVMMMMMEKKKKKKKKGEFIYFETE
jgi:hypothetical protein